MGSRPGPQDGCAPWSKSVLQATSIALSAKWVFNNCFADSQQTPDIYMLSRVQLFYDPVDCSPPGSSVHGILQTIILEWVAVPSSRGSS